LWFTVIAFLFVAACFMYVLYLVGWALAPLAD